ncbi:MULTISPECIES: BCD family MFS transporter [unclassified Synechococcus]|jgi:BCD family chlorophyll transporter-like MFS transporter|uniref:BCD family MFS transporter n=1 Tax=unclassified Synechococcus TaxID=2626047 RepID=UPI0000693ECF|nr:MULTISPECIES: BCD family MFS transporter [unclassified Synechococcus]ABC98272.1 putative transporter, bacteriochlorophyll delivery (BCD) family [Synechococcus sp. JA-3-3Ab]PIK89442.1 bacteriochlorophyll synthase subunit [Synechococcus sp. 65AY6A5]PIK97512.1 bacteriochlorophyll synthase subunit [Synechococcus sp. 63AY4M1]
MANIQRDPEVNGSAATALSSQPQPSAPPLPLLVMFRLGLFQMGLGMMSLLTLGVLNRVMIDPELLAIPATVVGGSLAMHQLVSPARVWFGQLSDAKPLLGTHRSGYVRLGSVLFALCIFLAVQVVWGLGQSFANSGWSPATYGWIALAALMFALYGLCLSACSTPFAALLVDVSDEHNRSQLVGIVWSMLMVGIAGGAIGSAVLLRGLDAENLQSTINRLFIIIPAVVILLGVIATWGVEERYSRYGSRSTLVGREDQITLGTAIKVLTASRQTVIFFGFLALMTMGLFIQQPILEPYGGEVFGMTVSQSTQLNAFWSLGILAGIVVTGFFIVPKLGKQTTTRLGCLLVALSFGLTIASGFTGEPRLLQLCMILFGLASGITTNGAISLMLDLTAAETAGTFIGAWGLAQAMSQALSTLIGGALLDLGRLLFPTSSVLAYATVFGVEAAVMLLAVYLLGRVSVAEFRENTNRALTEVLALELES